MKEKNVFLSLIMIILVLSLAVFSNVGYAIDTKLFTNTTSSHQEFDVAFNMNSKYSNKLVNIISPTTVSLKEINLDTLGQTQDYMIPISNNSENLFAELLIDIENSNPDYFEITSYISNKNLEPKSESFVKITVKLIKLPEQGVQTSNFLIKLTANPIYK